MLSPRAAWCLAFLSIQGVLNAQQYDLRTWSLEQGSPGATINAICEDQQGHLWIATNEGAARTDGIHFLVTGNAEGLPDDDVTAIHCAPGGDVWLGCRNGAIVVMRDLLPFIVSPGGAGGEVCDIRNDAKGRIWIAMSTGGVWIHEDEKLEKERSPGLPSSPINALVIGPDDRPLAGSDSGLHVLESGRWRSVPLPGTSPPVTSLYVDDKGVLAGTATGYLELGRDLKPLPPTERLAGIFPIALPDKRVSAVLRSKDGAIWVGTPSGLIQISKRGGQPFMRQIGEANGLGHDLVRSLHQDRSGAIWCGTAFGGLSRFMSDAFMHFTDRDGLRSRIVSAIHRTPDGLLYMATVGGGIAMWDGQRITDLGKEQGLDDPYVLALDEDLEGYLLAGTASAGVMRWDGRRFSRVPSLSPVDARVNVISRDREQRVWVGFDGGLLVNDGGGEVRSIGFDGEVLDIEHDTDTTWIATTGGLLFMTQLSPPSPHPLFPALHVVSITRDVTRNIWLGTDGHGLWRINGSRIDSITTEHNSMGGGRLASNSVMSVTLDAFQNVWAGTRRGMHELELDVLQEVVLGIDHYGVENGFIGLESFSNAAMLDVDSTLWFGMVGGATRYDQRVAHALLQEPRIQLTSMRLFFEDVDWSRWSDSISAEGIPRDLELPFNKNHITFNFTGISPAYPERVHYRYMLEGHDPDWSPITTTSEVIYSNIPPGDYTFKVHARNASGVWTAEPLSYTFSIRAPLWSRTWSQAAALVLLLLIGAGVMRYREQRSRKARERLERIVGDRTRELVGEQQRSESLLLNILPRSTADELKRKGSAHTRSYENCTVLFSDFTGFTEFSSSMDGHQLVADLDHFFRMFDRITDEFGIEKIKTIGDAYMCASGIPEPKPSHALDAVLTALRMLRDTAASNAERRSQGTQQWQIRIGIHSGPIVAGVVGEKKFAYDIWGNTVNVASRMESNSAPGRINISGATYAQVMEFVEVQPRGPVKVRGKGELQMYFVLRLKPVFSADQYGLEPNERLLRIRQEMLMLQEI